MIPIDWQRIRPLESSQKAAFEELCVQLARSENPTGFVRKGVPDAGVECFVAQGDGTEWAWQAKYFDSLADTQWGQIDESVRTALDKHPKLARYHVCIPYDRPDARIEGKKSAMERWNEHVAKWTGWATAQGTTVEFEYWGSSELLERLGKPEHAGKVLFWFGVPAFDPPWFRKRLDEVLKAAGPRYTPEVHVDLSIAGEFESFGRTRLSLAKTKSLAKKVRKIWREFSAPSSQSGEALDELPKELSEAVNEVFASFSGLELAPSGEAPYRGLALKLEGVEQIVERLKVDFERREAEYNANAKASFEEARQGGATTNPYRKALNATWNLSSIIGLTKRELNHQADLVEGKVMILRGEAGTGKTHLLCDVARKRIEAGMPTVLLMGQSFTTTEAPWIQVLHMVDLSSATAEEFVGALEASAQAVGVRALVMIDAVNEGEGRKVWPSHLESFLTTLSRSPWIGTVLSVRTSYEEWTLPEAVRQRAVSVHHRGFEGEEYEALKSYFQWYGIEVPSTPLLDPEFSNPLFLKTLCVGLKGEKQRRLPRGHHGITSVFNLYLDAVQSNLNSPLDLNPKALLVRRAVEAFSSQLAKSRKRWMPQSEAEALVNSFLPGRDFSRSLYRGLIDEGILTADANIRRDENGEEVVYIAYERLADHQVVRALLDKHFDPGNPGKAFCVGGALHYLAGGKGYTPEGVLEALSIQIPERCATEFATLVSEPKKLWGLGRAFAQSIVWRAPDAFNDDTLPVLDQSMRTRDGLDRVLDALVTVATLPEHKLNAEFLDYWLRSQSMPARDAWWSTYVHRAWQSEGALYRTILWAWNLPPDSDIEDEVTDLAGIVLAWTLTTSNRYARDRATKALVSLFTGRLERVTALVRRFADVDDPYVAERVYAVAYGVAMRCHDASEVSELARCVYDNVFVMRAPPAHILLRDYARGVIERALFLGADICVDETLIRPPYRSEWPHIPSDEEIQEKSKTASLVAKQADERDGRNKIFGSIRDFGDFGRYVIGTNGPHTDWLSLRLDEQKWWSRKGELGELIADFSEEERQAWDTYNEKNRELIAALSTETKTKVHVVLRSREIREADDEPENVEVDSALNIVIENLTRDWRVVATELESSLTPEHAENLAEILNRPPDESQRHGPRFDLSIIQRYVLWRVFDLGWTTERFDEFDSFTISDYGRSAQKAERVGKKYQWIAFHEIKALIADHFQYSEEFGNEPAVDRYEGPWQESLRDIDPSCILVNTVGSGDYDAQDPAWWAPVKYEGWAEAAQGEIWAKNPSDLPDPASLLIVTDPKTGVRWLNLEGAIRWQPEGPEDKESGDIDRQGIRYNCDALLVRAQDANSFVAWAESINFEMQRMPDAPQNSGLFLGEHPWSPAAYFSRRPHEGEEGWTTPAHDCSVKVRVPVFHYFKEASTFDCSVDETYYLRLPAWDLLAGLGLRGNGKEGEYVNESGELIAFDPTASLKGPSALLVREEAMHEYLNREGLALCWTVSGEKRLFLRSYGNSRPKWVSMTGIYRLTRSGADGSYRGTVEE